MRVLELFIPFLFFFGLNLWPVIFAKKSFGESLPVTTISSVFVLYFTTLLFKSFNPGTLLMVAMAFAAIPLYIVYSKKDAELKSRVFSYGFYCFLAICAFIFVMDLGRNFCEDDEFSHWGKFVSESLRLNNFYCIDESNVYVHKDYPPFVTLFEVLWCKVALHHAEDAVTMALHFLELTLIAPWMVEKAYKVSEAKPFKKFLLGLGITLMVAILMIDFDDYGTFSYIYTDIFLGVIYAYGLALLIDKKTRKDNFFYSALLLTNSALIMSKQVAICFVMLTWFAYTASVFFLDKDVYESTKQSYITRGIKSICTIAVPLIVYKTWSIYLTNFESQQQYSTSVFSVKGLIEIIMGGGADTQQRAYKSYIQAIHNNYLTTGMFKMTYFTASILGYILLYVLYLVFKQVYTKKDLIKDLFLVFFGSLGYAIAMFASYMFLFQDEELVRLAGYNRYLDSYLLGEYLFIAIVLVWALSESKIEILRYKYIVPALGIMILTATSSNLSAMTMHLFEEEKYYFARMAAAQIEANTTENDLVVVVSSNTSYYTFVNYYLGDRYIDRTYGSGMAAIEYVEGGYWDAIRDLIAQDGYVFISDATENVNAALGRYTDDGYLEGQRLYFVDPNVDHLHLIPIY